ncbi:hypothetical protein ACFLIM_24925 [Nonomuraea sp. M3C6]|uniref:Uncharacterized protein n=1 Tax=Nonomuraea marmarensis TaxID=3351344 RepID=A0ABW7AGG8_9ACTN
MIMSLAGTVLVAAAATTLMAAPASATSSTASTSTATSAKATTARPQLIRTKVYFGKCEDTCRIKVRITNISRKNLFNVKLNVSLKIDGRKAGSCYDYVGSIRARKVRWAGCTVRTATLARFYNQALDGERRFDRYASTYVSYRYYN